MNESLLFAVFSDSVRIHRVKVPQSFGPYFTSILRDSILIMRNLFISGSRKKPNVFYRW